MARFQHYWQECTHICKKSKLVIVNNTDNKVPTCIRSQDLWLSILAWLLYCSSSLSYWTYLSLLHDDINCHRKTNEEDNDEMPKNSWRHIVFRQFCISFWTNVDLLPTGINCPNPRKQSGKQNGVSEFASTIQCKRSQMLRLAIRDSSSTASKMWRMEKDVRTLYW